MKASRTQEVLLESNLINASLSSTDPILDVTHSFAPYLRTSTYSMPYMLQREAFVADVQDHDNQIGTKNEDIQSTLTMTAGDERNRHLVSWNGPNDPENPMNWSTRKRINHVALVSVTTFIS